MAAHQTNVNQMKRKTASATQFRTHHYFGRIWPDLTEAKECTRRLLASATLPLQQIFIRRLWQRQRVLNTAAVILEMFLKAKASQTKTRGSISPGIRPSFLQYLFAGDTGHVAARSTLDRFP